MLYVPLARLKVGEPLNGDIYHFSTSTLALIRKGQIVTPEMIEHMKHFGNKGVYMTEPGSVELPETPPPMVSPELRGRLLYVIQSVFEKKDFTPNDELRRASMELVDAITTRGDVLVNIADLKNYDDYTYRHSLSVAILSVAIGVQMKLSTFELNQLSLCALLHDIGKTGVPWELINKPAHLTDEEFDVVKKHSSLGLAYLRRHDFTDPLICDGVISHHERYDGSGYPNHLRGCDIPLFGRIISVADVFDALTSNRPYREPVSPADAAEYIMGNGNVAFDYQVVQAFLSMMEFYPVGSFVRLSNGELAVVLENVQPLRPTVQMAEPPYDILDLFHESEFRNITITESYPIVDS